MDFKYVIVLKIFLGFGFTDGWDTMPNKYTCIWYVYYTNLGIWLLYINWFNFEKSVGWVVA